MSFVKIESRKAAPILQTKAHLAGSIKLQESLKVNDVTVTSQSN
jgi:hypothetical protein